MLDLGPLSPGDDVPLDAAFWNELRTLVRERFATKRGSAGSGGISQVNPHGDTVSVLFQNRTGSDLAQYGVVGISDALVPYASSATEFMRRPQFRATTPAAGLPFAIVQQPLTNYVSDSTPNTIGRAIISGCTPCKLNVVSTSHKYAGPTTSLTELTTAATGPARILAQQSGTGTGKSGIVFLGGGSGETTPYDAHTLVATSTTVVTTANAGTYELTGWARYGVGGGTTRYRFPSTGVWLVTLNIYGEITITANGGTPTRAGFLYCQLTNFSGNSTIIAPDGVSNYGLVAAATSVNAAGDYTGVGSLSLSVIADVTTASADALTVTMWYSTPGAGNPTTTAVIGHQFPAIGAGSCTNMIAQKIG